MADEGTRAGIFERFATFKIAFLLVAVILVMAACGGDDEKTPSGSSGSEKEGGTITIEGQSANDHGEADVSGKSEADVEIDDFYFEPTVLTGSAGEEVTLHLENEGDTTHNFSISDQNIDEDVDAGDEADVKVTFPDSGTLVFFCKFHQGQGMLGGLEVSS